MQARLDMPDLHTIGRALYGERWQTDLSKALGVSERTVRRWVAGQEPPPGAWADMARVAESKAAELQRLARDMTQGA